MPKKTTINIPIKVRYWKNKSGIWIIYSKKFGISGYGNTKKRAKKMFLFVVKDILQYTMPQNSLINTKKL